jgi:hypothetical protein
MTARRPSLVGARGRAWLLAALASLAMGAPCGPGPTPQVQVYVDPPLSTLPHLTWSTVRIMVDAGTREIQAMDLDVRVTGGAVWLEDVWKGQFDDDGGFFLEPVVDSLAGTATDIVDLRHGASPATGTLRLARLRVFALSKGTATIEITKASLATPTGQALTVQTTSGTVEVE